jgi:hypothetical protein
MATFVLISSIGISGVQAHTEDEVNDWYAAWAVQVVEEGGLSTALLDDYRNWRSRHTPRQTYTPRVHRVSPGVEHWRSLVEAHFAPGNVETMLCLMGYESAGDPYAKNPISSARGLFQIMASIWAPAFDVTYEQLYDPIINTQVARKVLDIQGYGAWAPYNRGLCRGL